MVDDPERGGLEGLEAQWRLSAAEAAASGRPPGEADAADLPAWMRPAQPRWPPRDRGVEPQGAVRQPRGALRPGYGEVWQRLLDPTLHRQDSLVCWRLLHGQLGCNAFLRDVRKGSPATACCTAHTCGHGAALETLTHAFLECPEVQPAVDWALATWELLAGPQAAVPRTAAFLLADDPAGWDGAGDPGMYAMWTRLRVALIGAIWHVRCNRAGAAHGPSFAARVAKRVCSTLTAAIQRDWLRTGADVRSLDAGSSFCVDWWRGHQFSLSRRRFVELWAKPAVFCKLVGAPGAAGARAGPPGHLELLFQPGLPLPLPP